MPYFETEGYQVDVDKLKKITPLIQVRLVTLDEAPTWAGFFFKDEVVPQPEDLVAKNLTPSESLEALKKADDILKSITTFNHDSIDPPLRTLAEELEIKPGQLFGILRGAITAQKVSPPLFETMEILGRDVVLARVEQSIQILEGTVEKEGD